MAPRNADELIGTVVSVQELNEVRRGQWVLMKLLEDDEHGFPLRGEVLAITPVRSNITNVLKEHLPLPKRPPDHPFCVFKALPLSKDGEEARQLFLRGAEVDAGS